MLRYVKTFSKEKCLAISKVVMDTFDIGSADEDYLFYLPDSLFGTELKVDACTDFIRVYDDEGTIWEVPMFFCEAGSCLSWRKPE